MSKAFQIDPEAEVRVASEASDDVSRNAIDLTQLVYGDDKLRPQYAVKRIVDNFLARGKFTVLAGVGGVSKSTLSIHLANRIGSGRPFLGLPIKEQSRTMVLSLEDTQDDVNRLYRADFEQQKYRDSEFANGCKPIIMGIDKIKAMLGVDDLQMLVNDNSSLVINRDLHIKLSKLFTEVDASTVILDPMACLYGSISVDNAASNTIARKLASYAMVHNMSVIGVSHLTKAPENAQRGTHSVKFGGEITDASRSTAVLDRTSGTEKNELSVENDADAVKTSVGFAVTKNNIGPTGLTRYYSVAVRDVLCEADKIVERVQCIVDLKRPEKSDLFNPMIWERLLPYLEGDVPILRDNRGSASGVYRIEALVSDIADELGDELPVRPHVKPFVSRLFSEGRLKMVDGPTSRSGKRVALGVNE